MNRSEIIAAIAETTFQLIDEPHPILSYWLSNDLGALLTKLERADRRLKHPPTNEITETMIQTARDYPINQLFDFTRGRTICPFHKSKEPDLSYHAKSNRVHCFGQCGRSWNPIEVLMQRDNVAFPEAVRQLQG